MGWFWQSCQFAQHAHGAVGEELIQKILIGLLIVKTLTLMLTQCQHQLVHGGMDLVLLIVVPEIIDQSTCGLADRFMPFGLMLFDQRLTNLIISVILVE